MGCGPIPGRDRPTGSHELTVTNALLRAYKYHTFSQIVGSFFFFLCSTFRAVLAFMLFLSTKFVLS